VQPRERAVGVLADDGPAAAAEADQAGGELDDRAGLDLEAAVTATPWREPLDLYA
jgi:hypothetical protein